MGAQASQELDRWVSVSDLALISRKMRIIPTLPAECQVEALRYLWRSLRWVQGGTDLLTPSMACDCLYVILRGEAQAVLGCSRYMPLLPEGSYLCEAALLGRATRRSQVESQWARRPSGADPVWPLRRCKKLPQGVLGVVSDFLSARSSAPGFHGRVRTTQPTLVATLTRGQFMAALRKASDPASVPALSELHVSCNGLQNITAMGVEPRELGAQDIAALRVVCEGPMNMSCASVGPALRAAAAPPSWLFSGCCAPGRTQEEELSLESSR